MKGSKMSTRCQILIKDDYGDGILFYRHSDGYPDGAMPTLQKFMDWIRRGIIRDNAEQAAGWLVLIGAKEYDKKYVDFDSVPKKNLFEPDTDDAGMGWKCGAYEPAKSRHGDIEYLYILDLNAKTITCYETNNWDTQEIPDPKDKLQFVDTAEKPWKAKKAS
jgi:hypothetical protein